ncbi:hypothetical protein ACJX0J_026304 [Zea mays]
MLDIYNMNALIIRYFFKTCLNNNYNIVGCVLHIYISEPVSNIGPRNLIEQTSEEIFGRIYYYFLLFHKSILVQCFHKRIPLICYYWKRVLAHTCMYMLIGKHIWTDLERSLLTEQSYSYLIVLSVCCIISLLFPLAA